MDRAELADQWATALTRVAAQAPAREPVEFDKLLDLLLGCLVAEANLATASAVGARLVETGYHRPESVQACVDVLASGLPRLADVDDRERVPAVLAALVAGFTEAARGRQEDLRGALVAARENIERDLRASEARFQELFANSAWGMVISDLDGVVIRDNEALALMLGRRRGTPPPRRLADLFHSDECDYLVSRYAELAAGDGDQMHEETVFRNADGEAAWVRIAVSVLRDGEGQRTQLLTMVEDISDLRLLEDKLHRQGTQDRLTGLPNRQAFVGGLEAALGVGADLSVFHLGLDDFAVVNDGVGRSAGDHLLREVASRLLRATEHLNAVVARLSGDEFGVMVTHGPRELDVGAVAGSFNDALAEPTYVDGEGIAASATIAVVSLPSADNDANELLRATDIALRRRKRQGRRQWCMVDPEQNARYREHYRLAASVPGAWENGQLDVDLWPVVTLPDRGPVATQALLRWEHPELGTLDRERCEEILRDTGLGVPLGHWVLHHAAELAAKARSALYLELTPEQAADPDLVAVVRRVLADTGLEADQLELGMPAHALGSTDGLADENLMVLVDNGVRSVLTGFGKSRGDLACLEDLPIHTVRMSESVVARLARPDPTALFTRATMDLIPMVREVGISVLVTGLTEAAQADWWAAAGADLASGPVFG
ncbi:EAL domain-containing protein [Actinokineospora auranticolor]|uniref:PAS domain S-box-containing protein/diguanylate cyclase (GGDEF)-like protein n=1 Tax=Actinokineospora auranticolor TaxID=155976 RepID=A0A2S6GHV5_9PSEU|nr:EAL domain-containing protein [Actinokineospora auranticolor]PPK64741.1 PAS domain S-box-containing protein/diguanylate cyclase (GGDEF)-like protein [Actinokineospora auranticolor]